MKPLEGLGILVTRPAQLNSGLASRIAEAGGKALLFPTLEIAEIADKAPLYAIIDRLERFDLAVFISPNAVEKGMELIRARRGLPSALKIAAVGQGSAAALAREGVADVLVSALGNDSEALLALPELQDMAGRRVAIFRGVGGRETLAEELQRRGAEVTYLECYRRRKPDTDPAAILALGAAGGIAAITVTSAESARNLREMLGEAAWPWLKRTPLFALHQRIAAAAGELGWEEIHVTGPGDEGLVQGLIEWRKREKQQ